MVGSKIVWFSDYCCFNTRLVFPVMPLLSSQTMLSSQTRAISSFSIAEYPIRKLPEGGTLLIVIVVDIILAMSIGV